MNTLKSVYIALGSNQGQRQQFLQKAIDNIFEHIGQIENLSHVYETPAWGFKGKAFLNACIKVKTFLTASQVLNAIQHIEHQLGRVRSHNGYQNRNIDLDILFYENDCIDEKDLKVPHPALSQRDFVLYPLADIAAQKKHPILGERILNLKQQLDRKSEILKTNLQLKSKAYPKTKINYLCVEGNIGAGKTTFAEMLSQDYNAKLILERFQDNPFLPQFYKDPKRYAFPTEMAFLADRHQQLIDDISQLDLFSDLSVADYDLYKSLIFARVTLQPKELDLYKKVFDIMYRDIPKPDLYVYLYQNTERLLENIKKRGRAYEQSIDAEYLDKINQGYLNFIKNENRFKTKIIDLSNLDFVNNRTDYLKLIDQIFKS